MKFILFYPGIPVKKCFSVIEEVQDFKLFAHLHVVLQHRILGDLDLLGMHDVDFGSFANYVFLVLVFKLFPFELIVVLDSKHEQNWDVHLF